MSETEPIVNDNSEILLPPKPSEPLDSECCGTGCTPCVFDIYKNQVKRWEKDCQEILINGQSSSQFNEPNYKDQFITSEKYTTIRVKEIVEDAESVKIYTFSVEPVHYRLIREKDFPVQLGQHVLIKLDNIAKQFTILRINLEKNTFDILIKIYPEGLLTPLIDKLLANDSVEMRGPFGKPFFYKANSMKQIIIVAGGTGIAPMYRIIQRILNNEDDETRVKLMFACRRLQEFPLVKIFKEWSSHWNFEVVYYVSSKEEKGLKTNGIPYYGMKLRAQRIDCEEFKDQTKSCDIIKTLFLICGTKSFEKDMINNLSKLGGLSSNSVVF